MMNSLQALAFFLRQGFPERFQGEKSDELGELIRLALKVFVSLIELKS